MIGRMFSSRRGSSPAEDRIESDALIQKGMRSLFSIKNLQVSSSVSHAHYDNPLTSRYASPEMAELFGEQRKFGLWRRLWVVLAEAEREMGLNISQEQLDELKAHVDEIDFKVAAAYERKLRHDVMAHVHAYGDMCPKARPIIHLGATSCYITDNADLILMREAMQLLARRLATVIDQLGSF